MYEYLHICMHTICTPGTQGVQKRRSYSLGLELSGVVSYSMQGFGTEPGPPVRAASAPNPCVISLCNSWLLLAFFSSFAVLELRGGLLTV